MAANVRLLLTGVAAVAFLAAALGRSDQPGLAAVAVALAALFTAALAAGYTLVTRHARSLHRRPRVLVVFDSRYARPAAELGDELTRAGAVVRLEISTDARRSHDPSGSSSGQLRLGEEGRPGGRWWTDATSAELREAEVVVVMVDDAAGLRSAFHQAHEAGARVAQVAMSASQELSVPAEVDTQVVQPRRRGWQAAADDIYAFARSASTAASTPG